MADINIERIAVVHEVSSTITLERIIRCKNCQCFDENEKYYSSWKKNTKEDGFCHKGAFKIGGKK